ncbi:ThuA domain-containing protein [Kibdelosporangium aridum]|uniref:Type 1 glutamine amidotransferase (GATase1) n=1 Tax=Kibdelosporangium aridum TaxID=2030 RepID=A0A1Y5WT29_KIBAR|nr:ThuA domain-containing protein [Kibdelosporangium aridum]SMC49657.1 Type 1 glutamine amidotransferase (GATase1) [Kibdelosporangium aridum]
MTRAVFGIVSVLSLLAALVFVPVAQAAAQLKNVLVFHKTAGYQHPSIPAGIDAIRTLGRQNGFTVTATADANYFTPTNLIRFQAVVWLSTTGDVLNENQQKAFEDYIAKGGGYVGIHAAADTEYDWAWYGGLVGAYFHSHPANQTARIRVEDRSNVSTSHLSQTWTRLDEWYNYRANPRANVRVLASLDESSYSGGNMGDHPITWCHDYQGGRAWYTGLGHTAESYSDPAFTKMLLGGIKIASRAANADCRPENGYTPIFDGSQASLDQWRQAGPGGFNLVDGTLVSHGGMGLLWFPVRQFSNYSVRLDWMMPGDDNGGVFIGFPDPQGDPWRPVSAGHEIQIDATDGDPTRTTGSVYSFRAPDRALRDSVLNPPGQWNAYEIAVHGQLVEVWLNGVKINEYTSNRDIAVGYLGVQNDGAGLDISYRNIRVRQDAGGGGTDFARGRPVFVSSVEPGSSHVGENAVDGNNQTRWGSVHADPQWITVDLGETRAVERVRLSWEAAYARAYKIQISPDNENWTTMYSTETGDGGVDEVLVAGSGRYVRVEGTQRATQWGYSLWDLQVIGKG